MEQINFSENIHVANHLFHLQSNTADESSLMISLYEQGQLLSKQKLKIDFSSQAKRVIHDQVYKKHVLIKKGIEHLFHQFQSIEMIDDLLILSQMIFLFTKWRLLEESYVTLDHLKEKLNQSVSTTSLELMNDYIHQIRLALGQNRFEKALAILKLIRKELNALQIELMH